LTLCGDGRVSRYTFTSAVTKNKSARHQSGVAMLSILWILSLLRLLAHRTIFASLRFCSRYHNATSPPNRPYRRDRSGTALEHIMEITNTALPLHYDSTIAPQTILKHSITETFTFNTAPSLRMRRNRPSRTMPVMIKESDEERQQTYGKVRAWVL
jgi:hypothetical protein